MGSIKRDAVPGATAERLHGRGPSTCGSAGLVSAHHRHIEAADDEGGCLRARERARLRPDHSDDDRRETREQWGHID